MKRKRKMSARLSAIIAAQNRDASRSEWSSIREDSPCAQSVNVVPLVHPLGKMSERLLAIIDAQNIDASRSGCSSIKEDSPCPQSVNVVPLVHQVEELGGPTRMTGKRNMSARLRAIIDAQIRDASRSECSSIREESPCPQIVNMVPSVPQVEELGGPAAAIHEAFFFPNSNRNLEDER